MLVNIKVTGGLNIESGHIDPKATQGLKLPSSNLDFELKKHIPCDTQSGYVFHGIGTND